MLAQPTEAQVLAAQQAEYEQVPQDEMTNVFGWMDGIPDFYKAQLLAKLQGSIPNQPTHTEEQNDSH